MNIRSLAGSSRFSASARIVAALVFHNRRQHRRIWTADYRVHRRNGEGSTRRGGQHGHREGNQRGYRILPVGAGKRLWGVPHRLPSRGQVHRRGEAAGFERFVQQNVALDVDQTLTVDVTLAVGAATQTVTVTEAPPLVNTSDAVLGRTIEPDEIIGLPLVNRNIYSELSLTPGVMANNNSPTSNPTGTPNMTVGLASTAVQVNGSLDSGNGTVAFYLDGGNNITGMRNYGNPAPNPDAIEEFRVETSAFAAQYGQFSAAVVSVITKSGTNKFHGAFVRVQPQHRFQRLSVESVQEPRYRDIDEAPTTATTLAEPSAAPSSTTRPSSSSAMPVCARYKEQRSQALSRPRLPSAWATLPRTRFKVYNPKPAGVTAAVWDVPANQVMEQTPAPIAGCHFELHDTRNCIPRNPGFVTLTWTRPLQIS